MIDKNENNPFMRIETLEQSQINQLIDARSRTPDSCETPKQMATQRLVGNCKTMPI